MLFLLVLVLLAAVFGVGAVLEGLLAAVLIAALIVVALGIVAYRWLLNR